MGSHEVADDGGMEVKGKRGMGVGKVLPGRIFLVVVGSLEWRSSLCCTGTGESRTGGRGRGLEDS